MIRPVPIRRVTSLAAAALALAAAPAWATANVTTSRFEGAGRHETAVLMSQATFDTNENPDVVLARANDFPDALAGNYLANFLEAPILLTDTAELNQETEDEIERLGAERVTILGGEAAISTAVEEDLESQGYDVTRVGGAGRLDTAQLIATTPDPENVGQLGTSGRTALIARADVFADALAAGPVSWDGSFPTLLTDSATLSSQAAEVLDELDIEYAIVLGGEAAISTAVEASIQGMGITTQRLQGPTRTETAAAIADFARDQLAFPIDHVNVARGDLFADALAGGPHGGVEKAPILLTNTPDDLSAGTTAWLQANAATINTIHGYGGTSAISDATLEAARNAATTS